MVGLKKAQNNSYRCLGVYDMSFEECYLTKDIRHSALVLLTETFLRGKC